VNVCDASHASTARPSRARRDADAAPLYHRGFGRFLGHTFLLIAHQGRMTGKRRETVAMALTYDPETREAVVCSAWGPDTEWTRNLRAHPALEIQVGRERYVPEQRFLSADDAVVEGVTSQAQRCRAGPRVP
jgi:deazaflavin-dependent oxidoreductase (nitroreductase family)